MDLLKDVHHKWLLMSATRPSANLLEPVIAELEQAAKILTQSSGDHWSAAPLARSAAHTLRGMGRSELDASLHEAQLAYEEIAAHRAR
jgi:hypothetical protein